MNKETKKIWWIVAGSYAAGMLVAFLMVCFCCCPGHNYKNHKVMPMTPQQQVMLQHQGMHHHGRHHRGPDFRRQHHEPTAEMKARFAEKLGLTDEQKAQLEQYRNEDMAKMEPLMKQMDELRTQIRELRKAGRAHFESVLTDEQKEILQTMKKKHHHKRPHFEPQEDKAETEAENPTEANAE